MLYPIMPIYIKTIGFSIVLIGFLEGFAEALAGLSKGYFGKLSDRSGKRVPFLQACYALSAISKPMMAVFIFPLWIFFARSIDRFGKGIRTRARDAILSDEAAPEIKGKVFGFHRAMDTLGAFFGPLIALTYLYYYPQQYQTLFYFAFLPGVIAVLVSLLLKDKSKNLPTEKKASSFFSFLSYWHSSPHEYRKVVLGLLAFAVFNSSDIFLLLKAKQAGLNDSYVIGIYIFYNLVYATVALPIGILADKIGLKKMFIVGISLFAIVYFGMAFSANIYLIVLFFFLYGIYAAATEGISKAWISTICDSKDTATAIGTYSGFQSIGALIASSLAGLIWYRFGDQATFLTTGIATVLVVIYFSFFLKDKIIKNEKI
ncbi:MAG: MFS transporter [Methylotenera sp.]|nr:MFS transporter [Flavobacterium sp.]